VSAFFLERKGISSLTYEKPHHTSCNIAGVKAVEDSNHIAHAGNEPIF